MKNIYEIVLLIAGVIVLISNGRLVVKFIKEEKLCLNWGDWLVIVALIPSMISIAYALR